VRLLPAQRLTVHCYSACGSSAEYRREHVCLSLRPLAYDNNSLSKLEFLRMMLMTVARSSSGGVTTCVILVLWMTSYLPIIGQSVATQTETQTQSDSPEGNTEPEVKFNVYFQVASHASHRCVLKMSIKLLRCGLLLLTSHVPRRPVCLYVLVTPVSLAKTDEPSEKPLAADWYGSKERCIG